MTRIIDIEGIGDAYATLLRNAGVTTTEELLERGAMPSGREQLAEATGIANQLILRWVRHADLIRISGIAGEYAELLEAAGVETVDELARRDAASLANALIALNATAHLVRHMPSESQIAAWVAEAKTLPRRVKTDATFNEILIRTPRTGEDIFAEYDAERLKTAIRNAANTFSREEAEEIIQSIYAGRKLGSRSPEAS